MATAHIQAELGEIAKTVLMPGDPLRAKYIADKYLENAKQFNSVRNMFGYTGLKIEIHKGCIHSSDVFYVEGGTDYKKLVQEHECACVEMESFALFHNAQVLGKNAACLLTISDSFITQENISAEARQTSFDSMMILALETAIGFE